MVQSPEAQFDSLFKALKLAENIKNELRHSWLSTGRQESVAEHTWRLCLLVLMLGPKLSRPFDMERALKIALVHDLGEAEIGDVHSLDIKTAEQKAQKHENEKATMQKFQALLDQEGGQEIYDLWAEYEFQKSFEAQVVKALDKVEVFIQHNEADLSTWTYEEKLMVFQPKWKDVFCEIDPFLKTFNDQVNQISIEKFIDGGEDIEKLKKDAQSNK